MQEHRARLSISVLRQKYGNPKEKKHWEFFILNPRLYLEEPVSILSLSETLNLCLTQPQPPVGGMEISLHKLLSLKRWIYTLQLNQIYGTPLTPRE